jgi:hypothetical protein
LKGDVGLFLSRNPFVFSNRIGFVSKSGLFFLAEAREAVVRAIEFGEVGWLCHPDMILDMPDLLKVVEVGLSSLFVMKIGL